MEPHLPDDSVATTTRPLTCSSQVLLCLSHSFMRYATHDNNTPQRDARSLDTVIPVCEQDSTHEGTCSHHHVQRLPWT